MRRALVLGAASLMVVTVSAAAPSLAEDPQPGALDMSWSADGETMLELGNEASADIAAAPDGSVYSLSSVSGSGKIVVAASWFDDTLTDPPTTWVYRLRENGSLDKTFSGDGRRSYTLPNAASAIGMQATSNNRIVIVGSFGTAVDGDHDLLVGRLLPSGALEPAWSGDGMAILDIGGDATGRDVEVLSNGRTIVTFNADGRAGVARLLADGILDPSFSKDGFDVWPRSGDPQAVVALNDRYWIVTHSNAGPRLMRRKKTGREDHSIGDDGRVSPVVSGVDADNLHLYDVGVDSAAEVIYAVGDVAGNHLIVAIDDAGSPELSFGAGGWAEYGGPGFDRLTSIDASIYRRQMVQGNVSVDSEPVNGRSIWIGRFFPVSTPFT